MKWILCFILAFGLEVQSKSLYHATLGPEMECLDEFHLDKSQVHIYVHTVTEGEVDEKVGGFLACVWKKRQIMKADGEISGENIYRYFEDIYHKKGLSDSNKQEMRDALQVCASVSADKEYILADKIKNCMIQTVHKLPFLAPSLPHNKRN